MDMELLLFLVATAGATFIVVFSSIFDSFRKLFWMNKDTIEAIETKQIKPTLKQRLTYFFSKLIHCPLCFGFWMGAVMFLFVFGIKEYSFLLHFAYACAGSASSYLFYHIVKE